jgi:hypothetical protein
MTEIVMLGMGIIGVAIFAFFDSIYLAKKVVGANRRLNN